MRRTFNRIAGCLLAGCALILLGLLLPVQAQQSAGRECTSLSCTKCEKICSDTCNADFKACTDKNARNCPRLSRSCERGCKSQLCAQCLPIQYGTNNQKFLPGKTELCRTPGRSE